MNDTYDKHASLSIEKKMYFHGFVILMIGLLAGFPFTAALSFDWGEAAETSWHVAHTGGVSAGILTLVIGMLMNRLELTKVEQSLTVISVLASGYGFSLGMWLAASVGERGLLPNGTISNFLVFTFFQFGVWGILIGAGVLLKAAHRLVKDI